MRTETTAQRYLWLNCRAVVKVIQIASPSFICILKVLATVHTDYASQSAFCFVICHGPLFLEQPTYIAEHANISDQKQRKGTGDTI